MNRQPEIQGVSIVIVGAFSPTIYHPQWFAKNGILSDQEADTADIQVISPEVSQFKSDWFRLQVMTNRFTISTAMEPYYEPMRDIVINTLTFLKYSQYNNLGINLDLHYKSIDDKEWHFVGNKLVPKNIWTPIVDTPGMLSLVIESIRSDNYKGYIRTKVEPSYKVSPRGIYFQVNDHYNIQNTETNEEIVEILRNNFTPSIKNAKNICTSVLKSVLEE